MSQTTSITDPQLQALARAVETEEEGLRVVTARRTRLPYIDLCLAIEVLEARSFNVLEAFVLRAAHELHPVPTLPALAAMLGLDELFIITSWERLAEMGATMLDNEGRPHLTALGRESYLQGQLPPDATETELTVRYWAVSDTLEVVGADQDTHQHQDDAAAGVVSFPGFVAPSEAELEAAGRRAAHDNARLVTATLDAGLGVHQPEEGRTIGAVLSSDVACRGAVMCGLLVVQETLAMGNDEDTLTLRVEDLVTRRRQFDAEAILRRWMTEGRVTLADVASDHVGAM